MKNITIILVTVLTFTSCSLTIKKMMGLKNPKTSDKDRIEKFSRKYGVPHQLLFQLNAPKYWDNIKYLKQKNPDLLQYFLQPMQVRSFSNQNRISHFLFFVM